MPRRPGFPRGLSSADALAPKTRPQLDEHKMYLSYGEYAKLRGKIRMAE